MFLDPTIWETASLKAGTSASIRDSREPTIWERVSKRGENGMGTYLPALLSRFGLFLSVSVPGFLNRAKFATTASGGTLLIVKENEYGRNGW